MFLFFILLIGICGNGPAIDPYSQESEELKIVKELFRLRNAQQAEAAEFYFADTVKVYMKYLRNVPKKIITKKDKEFWAKHPHNRFEITKPIKITTLAGITTATVFGKEFLDGTTFQYERIEIKFDKYRKINYYRGFIWKQNE